MSLSSPPHVNILIIRNPNMQTQHHIAGGEPDHICDSQLTELAGQNIMAGRGNTINMQIYFSPETDHRQVRGRQKIVQFVIE